MLYFVNKLPKRLGVLEDLDAMVLFAHEYLNLPKELELEINFDYSLPKQRAGEADYFDGVASIVLNGRVAKRDFAATVFHEMVHIKQMLHNELTLDNGQARWKGKAYIGYYYSLPWEEEAFRLEQDMMKIFEDKKNELHRNR